MFIVLSFIEVMRAIGVNAVSVSSIEEGRNYEMVSKNADDQGYAVDAASAKVSPDIEWSGLTMTAQQRSKKILNDCWGSVSLLSKCCAEMMTNLFVLT